MNFTYEELRSLIELCQEQRWVHLGMLTDATSDDACTCDDPDCLNQVITCQTKLVSHYDGLLSKLYCLVDQAEVPTDHINPPVIE